MKQVVLSWRAKEEWYPTDVWPLCRMLSNKPNIYAAHKKLAVFDFWVKRHAGVFLFLWVVGKEESEELSLKNALDISSSQATYWNKPDYNAGQTKTKKGSVSITWNHDIQMWRKGWRTTICNHHSCLRLLTQVKRSLCVLCDGFHPDEVTGISQMGALRSAVSRRVSWETVYFK